MQWRNGEEVARIQVPDAERIQSRLAFHAAEIAHELHVIAHARRCSFIQSLVRKSTGSPGDLLDRQIAVI